VVDRFRVVPAAYVFLIRGDDVLLQLRQNTGYRDGFWAAAGAGHVEQDESVYDAATREIREEVGVDVASHDLTPLCAMHRTHRNHLPIDERVDFFFACARWSGEPRIVEPGKAADMRWWPLSGLPDPVVPHELAVLEGLRDGSLQPIVAFGF
jgi:8-oxo-dGTP pyrophosphatase MutT (NUDIX family)